MPEETHTERLLLRRVRAADLPLVAEIHCDPATHPFDPSRTDTPDHAAALLSRWQRDWSEHGFGYWHVLAGIDGGSIGFGGIRAYQLDGVPVLNLYFRFLPTSWGRGYASEMAGAAVAWADEHHPRRPVVVITNDDNSAAIRVAEKLGFVHSGQTNLGHGLCPVYRRQEPIASG